MAKNLAIGLLAIVIVILIGIVIVSNYNWFSQEWLIGLGITVGGIIAAVLIVFIKIKRR